MTNEHRDHNQGENKKQEVSVWRTTLKQYGIIGFILLAIKLVAGILNAMGVLPL